MLAVLRDDDNRRCGSGRRKRRRHQQHDRERRKFFHVLTPDFKRPGLIARDSVATNRLVIRHSRVEGRRRRVRSRGIRRVSAAGLGLRLRRGRARRRACTSHVPSR